MDAEITERDVALLMLGEEGWVRLGAVLSLRYQLLEQQPPRELLSACPVQGA